jgi:hypothetical protein
VMHLGVDAIGILRGERLGAEFVHHLLKL